MEFFAPTPHIEGMSKTVRKLLIARKLSRVKAAIFGKKVKEKFKTENRNNRSVPPRRR